VQIVDIDGYILSNIYKRSLVTNADNFWHIGYKIDENLIGTNSYLLAMRHNKPMEVVGAEHYCEIFQKTAVYASPIYNKAVISWPRWV
jgi:transcriptional regulator of acetoin/glycerol metabolism